MIVRSTLSLRIARMVVQNFRTFHNPTEISFRSAGGAIDEVAVFHGGNGTGKSNALAAIQLFFGSFSHWLRARPSSRTKEILIPWMRDPGRSWAISRRDWPPGNSKPLRIEIEQVSGKSLSIQLTPAGEDVAIETGGLDLSDESPDLLFSRRQEFEAPLGAESVPFMRLDSRRRTFSFNSGEQMQTPEIPLSLSVSDRLLSLATSLEPIDTERWRAFVHVLSRFKTLQGRDVNVVRMLGGPDLRFEIRGKQILRISELSSGEQQIVAVCAAVLTSRAAIVAIEEPEISLDPAYQELLRDVLREQVQNGLVDQIILESHVPIFDGPEVIRFSRTADGATSVERRASDADDELRKRARAGGADEQWVTSDGYTQLPKAMVDELGFQASGGHIWFLRSAPTKRWAAWTAAELDEMFGFPGEEQAK